MSKALIDALSASCSYVFEDSLMSPRGKKEFGQFSVAGPENLFQAECQGSNHKKLTIAQKCDIRGVGTLEHPVKFNQASNGLCFISKESLTWLT